jgi:hypothetical protein
LNEGEDNSIEFSNKLTDMIITKIPYKEISMELEKAKKSEMPLDWSIIGDNIASEVQSGKNHGFFTQLNIIDFAMQSYDADGERSIQQKFHCQFELAKNYSDQAGLKRKFELYENLVDEATSRLNVESKDDPFYYWVTRPLNRLAQLTQYWKGEEAAEPLWHRLLRLTTVAKEDSLQVISDAAPWFVEKNPHLFSPI